VAHVLLPHEGREVHVAAGKSKPPPPPLRSVTAIDWHPDGHFLATAALDGVVRIWTDEGALDAWLS
jgi:WD40 repeat protein